MGQSADAYLRYGYMMPERQWDEDRDEDDDNLDDEDLWFRAQGPDDIKALDLTLEESAAWNALPYTGPNEPKHPDAEEYSRRHGIYIDARREWLKANPLPAEQAHIGSYEGEHRLLALKKHDGKELKVWANWEAVPVDFADPLFNVDRERAKQTLDAYLTTIGFTPPDDLPGWHLIPLYG